MEEILLKEQFIRYGTQFGGLRAAIFYVTARKRLVLDYVHIESSEIEETGEYEGGEISFQSQMGKGSTFTFSLPLKTSI